MVYYSFVSVLPSFSADISLHALECEFMQVTDQICIISPPVQLQNFIYLICLCVTYGSLMPFMCVCVCIVQTESEVS